MPSEEIKIKLIHQSRRTLCVDGMICGVNVLNSQTVSKERLKEKETKPSVTKKKSDEVKHILKEKSVSDSRSKESKQRTGKSYLEERQRQAERREEQRKKLSQSQSSDYLSESKSNAEPLDKSLTDEDKKLHVKPIAADSETKEVDFKKERIFKKEEIKKNSYKYSSNKDKEADESRKTRRSNNEKTYSSNKKDYEKSEDSGRKRYSESRKGQDSIHRDRYKEKDKTKLSSQKKSSISTTDLDKNRNISNDPFKASGSSDLNKSMSKINKENIDLPNEDLVENSSTSKSNDTNKDLNEKAKEKIFETKDKVNPKRRKSLDNDKTRYSTTYNLNKVHAREKYTEKKRRNSVGSSDSIKGSIDIKSDEDDKNHSHNSIKKSQSKENILIQKRYLNSAEFDASINKNDCVLENTKDESEESNKIKRRNSTGETEGSVSEPNRRNSLGTDYKRKIGVFTAQKTSSKETTKKDKIKYEKKMQQNNRDPRTERRIRNKDRPSIEIYRPGMGKFSKQRLEREKVLGSSTEVDSPSSSPSPTPVLKHKTLATH